MDKWGGRVPPPMFWLSVMRGAAASHSCGTISSRTSPVGLVSITDFTPLGKSSVNENFDNHRDGKTGEGELRQIAPK
jgi:hypothetical protein